jgi:hypothetical protein
MPSEILAVGSGAAASGDVTIGAGEALTVCLKDGGGTDRAPNGNVAIQLKDDDGAYWTVETLRSGKPAIILAGPGTYRFARRKGAAACGVFSG